MPLPAVSSILRNRIFSPAQFAPALWLEARRTEVIFTSNAGTGAISDGASVGYWGDISGNAFDLASAADDTTRPTYRANAGFPYVEFDGTNDLLQRVAVMSMNVQPCSCFVVLNSPSAPSAFGTVLCEASTSGGQPYYCPFEANGTTTTSMNPRITNSGGATLCASPIVDNVFDTKTKVLAMVDIGGTMMMFIDGINAGVAGYSDAALGGTLVKYNLGARDSNFGKEKWAKINVFALVVILKQMAQNEVMALSQYLRALGGV